MAPRTVYGTMDRKPFDVEKASLKRLQVCFDVKNTAGVTRALLIYFALHEFRESLSEHGGLTEAEKVRLRTELPIISEPWMTSSVVALLGDPTFPLLPLTKRALVRRIGDPRAKAPAATLWSGLLKEYLESFAGDSQELTSRHLLSVLKIDNPGVGDFKNLHSAMGELPYRLVRPRGEGNRPRFWMKLSTPQEIIARWAALEKERKAAANSPPPEEAAVD